MADTLAPGEVLPLLRGRFGQPYRYAEVCPSTQRLFAAGDPEGAVAAAEEQTEGRGRLGRIWLAPPATSILASIVLVPQIAPERLPELSLVAGDAVARAIASETGAEPRVRFPNDVLIVEALAQTGAVAVLSEEANRGRLALFAGIDDCRFKRIVEPGDTLELRCDLEKVRGPVGRGKAEARVGKQLACRATLTFAVER